MGVVANDGQYFESQMYNQFFTIKPRISEKNGRSKIVHLILRMIIKLKNYEKDYKFFYIILESNTVKNNTTKKY